MSRVEPGIHHVAHAGESLAFASDSGMVVIDQLDVGERVSRSFRRGQHRGDGMVTCQPVVAAAE